MRATRNAPRPRPALGAALALGAPLALSALFALCAACRLPGGARLSDKARSWAPYAPVTVAGEPLAEFLRARTFPIYSGVGDEPDSRGSVRAWIGAATALTPDGYFVTAAHAALPPPLFVQIHPGRAPTPARVVWDGRAELGVDLALVHADAWLERWFAWAPESAAVEDAAVVAGGYGASAFRVAGGHLRSVEAAGSPGPGGPAVLRLSHDTPTIAGDSGGPLATVRGELLGVHTSALYIPFVPGADLASYALRPAPDWITARIEADRAARAAAGAGATPEAQPSSSPGS